MEIKTEVRGGKTYYQCPVCGVFGSIKEIIEEGLCHNRTKAKEAKENSRGHMYKINLNWRS